MATGNKHTIPPGKAGLQVGEGEREVIKSSVERCSEHRLYSFHILRFQRSPRACNQNQNPGKGLDSLKGHPARWLFLFALKMISDKPLHCKEISPLGSLRISKINPPSH